MSGPPLRRRGFFLRPARTAVAYARARARARVRARVRALAVALAAVAVVCAGACSATTGTDADVADLRGTWQFVGQQSAPALGLTGTLVISSQNGDVITGSLSWEEDDGAGGVRLEAAALSGRVIGMSDVDFDVFAEGGARRHVARLEGVSMVGAATAGGSMEGAWVQVATGRSGTFSAARQ